MFAFMFKSIKAIVMTLGVLCLFSIMLTIAVNTAIATGLLETETTTTYSESIPVSQAF